MKTLFTYSALIVIAILMTTACKKKPTDNINLKINTDFIKYIATVKVTDAANANLSPSNILVSVSGADAQYVYSMFGKKNIVVGTDGLVQMTIDPARTPATGNPINFNVEISAAGYLPMTANVIIQAGQVRVNCTARMINLSAPPAGLVIKPQVVTLSGGALATPGIFNAAKTTNDSAYYDNGVSTIVLPQGTTFYYYKTTQNLVQGTKQVPVTSDSTVQYGDITHTYKRITGYYDEEYSYLTTTVTKVAYTGAQVTVIPIYQPGVSVDYVFYPLSDAYGNAATVHGIHLLNGNTVTENNLLFKSVVQQKLVGVYFVGTVTDDATGKAKQICISPDSSYHWFTSMVLDSTITNPITGQHIKEGDSIETGIDPATFVTLRSIVQKSNNGQLRIQTQSADAGFYYEAQYKNLVNISADVSVDTNVIPDLENLSGVVSLQYTGGSTTFNFNQYVLPVAGSGSIALSYAINSSFPISLSNKENYSYYWGQKLTSKTDGSDPFSAPFLYNLNPIVDFSLTFDCTSKSYYPTYCGNTSYTGTAGNGYFYFNLINGHWKTRGVKQGQSYNLGTTVCDGSYTNILFVINGTHIVKEYGDPVLCKCYF